MAKINFDTSKRLDITCRRGDSFELELTLKDSSGIPINLFGTGGTSSFEMLITSPLAGGSTVVGAGMLAGTSEFNLATKISTEITDLVNTTTADTTDAAYEPTTAATGIVKFAMTAEEMEFSILPTYQISAHYVYDIKYINPNIQVDNASEAKTILFGTFVMKGDGSVSSSVTT